MHVDAFRCILYQKLEVHQRNNDETFHHQRITWGIHGEFILLHPFQSFIPLWKHVITFGCQTSEPKGNLGFKNTLAI